MDLNWDPDISDRKIVFKLNTWLLEYIYLDKTLLKECLYVVLALFLDKIVSDVADDRLKGDLPELVFQVQAFTILFLCGNRK